MQRARELVVQLLVGVMLALAIVYLPMSELVRKAELARALNGIDFGPTMLSGDPGISPGIWKVIFGVVGVVIVAIVYRSFEAPRRALIVNGVLAVGAGAITVNYARGIAWFVVAFVAIAGAVVLTIWHDRWLGGYVEDEAE